VLAYYRTGRCSASIATRLAMRRVSKKHNSTQLVPFQDRCLLALSFFSFFLFRLLCHNNRSTKLRCRVRVVLCCFYCFACSSTMHKTISLSSHALCAALLLEKSLMVTTHFFPFYVLKTFTPELVLEKAARR
jgi:hypothetical protein